MNKRNIFLILFLGILFLNFISAWTSSTPQLSQYGISTGDSAERTCEGGTDFIMQIEPFGCTPAVVRTDLLEENNVPVFCQLAVTKINPLVNVNYIDSVSITGDLSPYVSGVAFYPARASLNTGTALAGSVLENIGYVVINVKKQTNASAIPEIISGNLTASLKYDIDEALGLGGGTYYIPELSDEEWETKKDLYQFWGRRGYLKVDSIDANSASVSIYRNSDSRISTVNLEKGETSDTIYIPDVDCSAGINLKLTGLDNPTTRAQLRVNSEVIEVGVGEKFLDNKCSVRDIDKNGLVQKVTIQCKEDEKTNNFDLIISPKVLMNIDGENKEVGIGEYLYDEGNKAVYLAYVGTKGNSNNMNDLFVYLVSMPRVAGNLSESDISSFNFVAGDLMNARQENGGAVDFTSSLLKGIAGLSNRGARLVGKQQSLSRINFGTTENVFGKQISLISYAGSVDGEIDSRALPSYEKAKESYSNIREQYSSEIFLDKVSYGEQALISEINLAYSANQKRTAADLCDEFERAYPDSIIRPYSCDATYKLSSDTADEILVVINSRIKTISLDGIYEPLFEDYGVVVSVVNATGNQKEYRLTLNQVVYLDETGNDYMQLISVNGESAQIKISVSRGGFMDVVRKEFGSDNIKLERNIMKEISDYSFTLEDINLKKTAKIVLNSNINNAGTKTNFSFQLGIEQRAIKLSPGEIEEKLKDLNESIEKWQKISDNLNSVVTGLKTSCLATGVVLITKNFVAGLGGAGTARQIAMRGTDGWFEKCTDRTNAGEYDSVDECLAQNSQQINNEVETLTKQINEQNDKIKSLEDKYTTTKFLSGDIVDNDAFMQDYSSQVAGELDSNSAIPETISDPTGKGVPVNKAELLTILSYDGWKNNYYSTEQIRNIELYSSVLNDPSASDDLKATAEAELYAEVSDIKSAAQDYASRQTMATNMNVDSSMIGSFETDKTTKKIPYLGLTNGQLGSKKIAGISDNTPVYVMQTFPEGKQYILVLDNSGGTDSYPIKNIENRLQIYDYGTVTLSTSYPAELQGVYFVKKDSSSYKNAYKSPELTYYETEPYKGLPAVVPFDTINGWYAATKQTLPVGGNLQTYDASGKVNSFYLCNVGTNGLEEFSSSSYGDDECILINTGTGQPYDQVPGLEEDEARKLVSCALRAIEQAANFYPATGSVRISTSCGSANVKIGEPAIDVPDFTCQDFMSPDECMLLFNLCDPVICPSSRCDFGGAYPVSDVVQSGIIGSLVLCFPNYKEGILMPVCLTGVKAGIDSLLSVKKSYRDCLQEALDTGNMVGICDEIYSIYMCDFFWKQALPLADIVIPKVIESLLGQGGKGGGEYLTVQDSWERTEQATSYFTNYYGANAKEAFLTRAKEVVQGEVCSTFISGVAPSGADLLDSLTAADSPPQYYGNFEENSLTTASVPALSHYKVFYHIYAGENAGAYYQVYLKGGSTSSYYQDSSSTLSIASGYASVGGYATETKDITGTAGYTQLCISVNGEEECGFKSVTTSFALNYAKDSYLSDQASMSGITTQSECISGTTSLYNILNLNLQSGIENAIDPAIYTQGIIRVCATSSPGKATDVNYDNENARWIDVGYCDDEDMQCWIDTDSVKNVVRAVNLENATLEDLSNLTIEAMQGEGEFLTDDEFASVVKGIEEETDNGNKITLIDNIFGKVVWSYQKAKLLLLKGDAYYNIFNSLFAQYKSPSVTSGASSPTKGSSEVSFISYDVAVSNVDVNNLDDAQKKVLSATQGLNGDAAPRAPVVAGRCIKGTNNYCNCWDAAYQTYRDADVPDKCVYSTRANERFTIANEKCYDGNCKKAMISTQYYRGSSYPIFAVYENCPVLDNKLNNLKTGDLLSYAWNNEAGHNAIFIGWKDKTNEIAYLFDWNDWSDSRNPKFRYYEEDLSDNMHPVYVYWRPPYEGVSSSAPTMSETISSLPADTQEDFATIIVEEISGEEEVTEVSSTENEYTESEYVDTTYVSYDIYQKAGELVNEKVSSLSFVRLALSSSGTGIQLKSGEDSVANIKSLENELADSNSFDVLVKGDLEAGDVVFLANGCNLDYAVGIFTGYENDVATFYTSYSNNVGERKGKVFDVSQSEVYVYLAYRYVADRPDSTTGGRGLWTVKSALDHLSSLINSITVKDYADDKEAIDGMIMDGLFTEAECKKILPNVVFGITVGDGAKISDIKNMLLLKDVSVEEESSSEGSTEESVNVFSCDDTSDLNYYSVSGNMLVTSGSIVSGSVGDCKGNVYRLQSSGLWINDDEPRRADGTRTQYSIENGNELVPQN